MQDLPVWVSGPASGFLVYVVMKFFAPAIKGSWRGQADQWRSESKYIKQLEDARDRAFKDRDLIAKERDDLFKNFASLNARFEVLENKFEESQKQVTLLTEKFGMSELRVSELTIEIQKLTRDL